MRRSTNCDGSCFWAIGCDVTDCCGNNCGFRESTWTIGNGQSGGLQNSDGAVWANRELSGVWTLEESVACSKKGTVDSQYVVYSETVIVTLTGGLVWTLVVGM